MAASPDKLAGLTADDIRKMHSLWQTAEVLDSLSEMLDEVQAHLAGIEGVKGYAAPGLLCRWHDGIEALRDDEIMPILRIAQERHDELLNEEEADERDEWRRDYNASVGVKTGPQ